jgi:hypothetical protein
MPLRKKTGMASNDAPPACHNAMGGGVAAGCWMPDVLTPKALAQSPPPPVVKLELNAEGGFPEVPAPPHPRVYSVLRQRFLAPARSTREDQVWCAVVLPAIGAFQRPSSQHLLRYWCPSGLHFVLCFRSAPSGGVQRTRCGACGLGHPHLVWWAPPVHSSCLCLAPVSLAGFLIKCLHVHWQSLPQCRFAALRGRFRAVWAAPPAD